MTGLLDGKVAVVSGTGPNIGAEIVRTFAEQGAKVICLDYDEQFAKAAAQMARDAGSEATAIRCDITNPDDVQRAADTAAQAFGGLDILVNDAAVTDRTPFLDESLEEWNRTIGVILTGTFLVSQRFARHLVAQGRGGAIVNLISTSGHRGEGTRVAYGVAKSGLLNLTRSMAVQLAPHNIRVNSVTPTQTGTPVGRPDATPRSDDEVSSAILRRRWGRPRDQANAVLFMASPMADFITGVDLPCDGGLLATFPR